MKSPPAHLTTSRGAALYIGALLGPGLLLVPGLAAALAGPASILSWVALLALSALFALVFVALGRRIPSAGGVIGYVAAGLGSRAGRATGWSFLAAVVAGAPVVCLIGASYVTTLTGGGRPARAVIAGLLLLGALVIAGCGLKASTTAQLGLVSLLVVVIAVAVAGSAPAARSANWAPFAPHGWMGVGRAAAMLMLSFVGWEAVAPLITRFASPARQLPRVVAIALAVTTVLYLGLAVTTVGVLGPAASTSTPLTGLLTHVIGSAGIAGAAVAAVILTMGTINAYLNGAVTMAAHMAGLPRRVLFSAVGASGFLLLTLYGLGLVSTQALVAIPTALFLVVYLGCMASAIRILRGPARMAAIPAAVAVAALLPFCGWSLAAPVVILLATFVGDVVRTARSRALYRRHALLVQPTLVTLECQTLSVQLDHEAQAAQAQPRMSGLCP